MAKRRKNILSDKNSKQLPDILEDLYSRLIYIEDFMIMQSKLLNTNILRTTAILDILIEKKILTEKEIEKRTKDILDEVKLKSKELRKGEQENILRELDSDKIGHA